jgi:DNA-binding CsgD family transcriptional regulator
MSITDRPWAAPAPDDQASPLDRLTVREREVTAYISRGTPNKVIAAELGISQRTIEAHRARIFLKLQVRNAVQLVRECAGWGLDVGAGPARGAEAAPRGHAGISVPGRPEPAWTTAQGSGRCQPGASGANRARAPGRSGGSGAKR